jgi:hypothetical protein
VCDIKCVSGENFGSEKEAKFSGRGKFTAAKQTGKKQVQGTKNFFPITG